MSQIQRWLSARETRQTLRRSDSNTAVTLERCMSEEYDSSKFRYFTIDSGKEDSKKHGVHRKSAASKTTTKPTDLDVAYPGGQHFIDNSIRTTRYTLWNFAFKSLFEQFRRPANVYFLIAAALSVTKMSPISPFFTVAPLAAVLAASMIKEGIEDKQRRKQDYAMNTRNTSVLKKGSGFVDAQWHTVRVGDLIKVKKNCEIPVDLMFLSSSNADETCYIETANLDGETNLKVKSAVHEGQQIFFRDESANFLARVECEKPDTSLYTFIGNLYHKGKKISLTPNQVVLRGCRLRNTNFIIGAVINTGMETKIMMNSTKAPSKRSTLEKQMDKLIFVMFAILFSTSIFCAMMVGIWTEKYSREMWYLDPEKADYQYDPDDISAVVMSNFVTNFILYGYFIPISLYISIEFIKIFTLLLINVDEKLLDEETGIQAAARTSNLHEELGQVHTILTDKTGTLTANQMEFLKCSIGGVSYGKGIASIDLSRLNIEPEMKKRTKRRQEKGFNFEDPRLEDFAWLQGSKADAVANFFQCLALCNTVVPDGPKTRKEIIYECESPDEAALVVAAKKMGFFLHTRDTKQIVVCEVQKNGTFKDITYTILHVLAFSSERKRMSIICRNDQSGAITIFCKGADSTIYKRLSDKSAQVATSTAEHLSNFAQGGLRTLCIARRELGAEEYESWNKKLEEASIAMGDREEKKNAVYEEIEIDLDLLGATAIEDKLQENVPQTIYSLRQAGIVIWMLTGDKLETAINIGFACRLISEEQLLHQIQTVEGSSDKESTTKVRGLLVEINNLIDSPSNVAKESAFVIDGAALGYAMEPEIQKLFEEVTGKCKAVICCRVSPLQKALVTTMVKRRGRVTLAVGDGANDVGMIQAADIGVGISGQEGMQAVLASDVSIAKFKFLNRLLLVHGRWCYKRLATTINIFFFKNVTLGVSLAIVNGYSFFSGTTAYDDSYLSMYSVVFTSLPPLIYGLLDQDVEDKVVVDNPGLYRQGQESTCFNLKVTAYWLLNGLYQGTVITMITIYSFHYGIDNNDGKELGIWSMGLVMYNSIIWSVSLQWAIVIEHWTIVHHICIWGSLLLWYIFLLSYGAFPIKWSGDMYGLYLNLVSHGSFIIFVSPIAIAAAVLPSFAIKQCRRLVYPHDHEILQEAWYQKRKRGRVIPTSANQSNSIARKSLKLPAIRTNSALSVRH